MEFHELFGSDLDGDHSLPSPSVVMRRNEDQGEWTSDQRRGIICNPIYAGIGPYPAIVNDQVWIRAASMSINEDGNEQFLVNMLHLLRHSFEHADIDFG